MTSAGTGSSTVSMMIACWPRPFRPTSIRAMLILRSPRIVPNFPTMPGTSGYAMTSMCFEGRRSMSNASICTTRGDGPSKTVPATVRDPSSDSTRTETRLL